MSIADVREKLLRLEDPMIINALEALFPPKNQPGEFIWDADLLHKVVRLLIRNHDRGDILDLILTSTNTAPPHAQQAIDWLEKIEAVMNLDYVEKAAQSVVSRPVLTEFEEMIQRTIKEESEAGQPA